MTIPARALALAVAVFAAPWAFGTATAEVQQTPALAWTPVLYYEALNSGDLKAAVATFDPSFQGEDPVHGRMQKLAAFYKSLEVLYRAFPKAQVDILDVVQDGQNVTVRFRFRGVQKEVFHGLPAHRRKVDVFGIDLWTLSQGHPVTLYSCFDTLRMLQQLGVIPRFR